MNPPGSAGYPETRMTEHTVILDMSAAVASLGLRCRVLITITALHDAPQAQQQQDAAILLSVFERLPTGQRGAILLDCTPEEVLVLHRAVEQVRRTADQYPELYGCLEPPLLTPERLSAAWTFMQNVRATLGPPTGLRA